MKTRLTLASALGVLIGFGGAVLLGAGCASGSPKATSTAVPPVSSSAPVVAGGAELWARNCGHCHNIRSPSSYSDSQWDVAMMHMRVRANLTAEEHKKILAFLKTAH